jgi:hypothetical protein
MKLIAPQGAGQNDRRHKPRRVYEPALSIHRTDLMRFLTLRGCVGAGPTLLSQSSAIASCNPVTKVAMAALSFETYRPMQ